MRATEFHIKDGTVQGSGQAETPDLYLHRARFLIAGVMAERLFDPDYRAGSSLDEIVMAQIMASRAVHLAGLRTAGWSDDRYFDQAVRDAAGLMLLRNQEAAKGMAQHLFDHGSIAGDALNAWTGRIR